MIEIVRHIHSDCFICHICSYRIPVEQLLDHITSKKHLLRKADQLKLVTHFETDNITTP